MKILSSKSLETIAVAISSRRQELSKIHWNGVCFGASEGYYKNIQLECEKLNMAEKELNQIFEDQFKDEK
jgi:hypothetical protein